MLHTIKFNELSALLLDFVDAGDGFLYLRLVGPETAVGAIWAKLAAKEGRGKKWGSEVSIPIPGRSFPQYVAAQKGVTYRTLRARLASGLVDLALAHPLLTVAEDNSHGFYLLTYDRGMPAGFFERLNRCLSLPLKPEWAGWLWELGQQPQTLRVLETRQVYQAGQTVEKTQLAEISQLPISRLDSLGKVACYAVHCDGRYRQAWLQLIRQRLGLGIRLHRAPAEGGERYLSGDWEAYQSSSGWVLRQGQTIALRAPSLEHLLTEARDSLGLYLTVQEEDTNGSSGS